MSTSLTHRYATELDTIREQGLFKSERVITSPQSSEITLADGRPLIAALSHDAVFTLGTPLNLSFDPTKAHLFPKV